ncbi:MAG TPA: hypothetical protein VKI65_01120 [Gemmataceae bacterium]|nr:hypothetical protein [Gemmataceae bacterium]
MTTPKHIHDIMDHLAAAEDRFLKSNFLAPMLRGGRVQVRIAGVVCQLKVAPADFEGWGVFQPISHAAARLVRLATLTERQRYLELFPRLWVILCGRRGEEWLAIPANQGDRRFRIDGMIPVRLMEEAQLFEVVECRLDGSGCWFERLDGRRDPGTAAYLRNALNDMTEPDQLSQPGLTAEERTAYGLNFWPRRHAELEAQRDRTEERLRDALAHAGAEYRGYLERGDSYRVEFEVAGRRHVSVVAREDLTVQVAGICLSGEDAHFDLHSLVGVIREAEDQGAVVPVGPANRGMEEEQYWRAHPPPRP